MNKPSKNSIDGFVLHELKDDLDLALNRCRALAKPDCDDRILAIFHKIVTVRSEVHDFIEAGRNAN